MSEEKKGFFARLKEGLTKTRDNIVRGIDSVFSGFSAIDDDFYEELEEILIMGDIGVNATTAIVERLKQQVKEKHIKEPSECKQLLIESIKEQMQVDETAYDFEREQSVIMVIVLDGTTGQNALVQAREFGEVADLTGIILTKMDGTAKGGIAVAIQSELKVPVKYIGVGESIEDLQKFNSDEFVNALFDVNMDDIGELHLSEKEARQTETEEE